jgi:hypothetical protein
VELRFTTPELGRLDLAATEVLLACLVTDERPPHGVVGLVDWRLSGRVSRLIASGFATGAVGEVVLIPGRPKLTFDKVLLFGIGPRGQFTEHVFRSVVERMLSTLENLRIRNAVAQLPGRHTDRIAPERAADILLETAGGSQEHDVWTLTEPVEAQRSITQHMVQERRRRR